MRVVGLMYILLLQFQISSDIFIIKMKQKSKYKQMLENVNLKVFKEKHFRSTFKLHSKENHKFKSIKTTTFKDVINHKSNHSPQSKQISPASKSKNLVCKQKSHSDGNMVTKTLQFKQLEIVPQVVNTQQQSKKSVINNQNNNKNPTNNQTSQQPIKNTNNQIQNQAIFIKHKSMCSLVYELIHQQKKNHQTTIFDFHSHHGRQIHRLSQKNDKQKQNQNKILRTHHHIKTMKSRFITLTLNKDNCKESLQKDYSNGSLRKQSGKKQKLIVYSAEKNTQRLKFEQRNNTQRSTFEKSQNRTKKRIILKPFQQFEKVIIFNRGCLSSRSSLRPFQSKV